MGSQRIVGLDLVKGIGIFMMIIVHAVTQVIADYDGSVFFSIKDKIPKPLLYCIVYPLMIVGLWGTVFTMVTGITTSLSAIRIMKNNKRAFIPYLLQRWIFLVFLRLGECITVAFGSEAADPFNNKQFQLPPLSFGGPATTLDSIGWSGIISPLLVFCLYPLIKLNKPIFVIVVFSCLSYLFFAVSPFVVRLFTIVTNFFAEHHMGLIADISGKIALGRFKIAETSPFMAIGAMYGVLISYGLSVNVLYKLSYVYFVLGIVIFAAWLLIDPSFLDALVSEDVPLPAQIISFGCICLLLFVHTIFVDGDRQIEKKLKSRKRVTYLLRLGMLSLTVFCIGSWVGKQLSLPWQIFFGPPCTHSPPTLLWSVWVCIAFTVFLLLCWIGISILWEKVDFKCSMEHILGWILSTLFGREYKPNNRALVYGPAEELEKGTSAGDGSCVEISKGLLSEEVTIDTGANAL